MIPAGTPYRPTTKALLLLWAGLFGCVTPLDTAPARFSPENREESIVFGRLILERRSDEIADAVDRRDRMTLILTNESSRKRYEIVCEKGGGDARFFALLPPGEYLITRWAKGKETIGLRGAFKADRGEAVYLGTIRWRRTFPAGSPSGEIRGTLGVEDRYDEEARLFRERYPRMDGPIVKSILKMH